MSDDLIRRSDAIKALNREKSDWNCDYNVPIDNCIKRLNKVKSADRPSIDIVRCKECRWRLKNLTEDDEDEAYLHCPIEDGKPDDFCSYAERKEK